MKHHYMKLIGIFLLCLVPLAMQAQEGLQTGRLFDRYGEEKDVTRVELNGKILKSYRMETYRSLVFRDVTPYIDDIQACLKQDSQSADVRKRQEVTEGGVLLSAYYQLSPVSRRGKLLKRYLLFKRGKGTLATIVYIEGTLDAGELMEMLYQD